MEFDLEDGGHTVVFFYKDRQGMTHPFPVENADIVSSSGMKESKEMLDNILMDRITALKDRMYIAFMSSPITPYKIRCYCGHVVKVDHDDKGYYIEVAAEVIFDPGYKLPARVRGASTR